MRRLGITHYTRFEYSEPVALGEHRLMFRPRDSHDLRLLDTGMLIKPAADIRWMHDVFSNSIALATFAEATSVLEITSSVEIELYGAPAFDALVSDYAATLPFIYDPRELPDIASCMERHDHDPMNAVSAWANKFVPAGGQAGTMSLLLEMTAAIKRNFRYSMRHESGVQSPARTLELGSGTCRDFALLMMEGVRSLGLAARFVTGYIYVPALDNGDGTTREPAWPHAWVQVYVPGAGWLEFDPTNGIAGGGDLIRVAVGRDPSQAMPVNGSFTGPAGAGIAHVVNVSVFALPPPAVEVPPRLQAA